MEQRYRPVLSIGISSYNNNKWIFELVSQIFQSKDERFNVVVSDNCSTDGTYEKLGKIEDKRLKLFQNKRFF